LFIGVDGIASGDGEVWGQVVDGEPADFLRFLRLTIPGVAARHARQISGRNPVLAFAGQEMIGDAQERINRDGGADFFQRLADGTVFEGFKKVEFAADDAPATGLGGRLRSMRSRRSDSSTNRIPTPTLGLAALSKETLRSL